MLQYHVKDIHLYNKCNVRTQGSYIFSWMVDFHCTVFAVFHWKTGEQERFHNIVCIYYEHDLLLHIMEANHDHTLECINMVKIA